MKPRLVIVGSAAVLALAACAVVMLGATAHAQLLKNMNNTNFSGPYACRGAAVVEGFTASYEFVLAPTGYGIFTGGSLVLQLFGGEQKCTLDIAHSGYQVLADGEGVWELTWNCNYGELDDVGYFNGALPPSPTGHFEEIRFADGLFCGKEPSPNPDELLSSLLGAGNCQRQLP